MDLRSEKKAVDWDEAQDLRFWVRGVIDEIYRLLASGNVDRARFLAHYLREFKIEWNVFYFV